MTNELQTEETTTLQTEIISVADENGERAMQTKVISAHEICHIILILKYRHYDVRVTFGLVSLAKYVVRIYTSYEWRY